MTHPYRADCPRCAELQAEIDRLRRPSLWQRVASWFRTPKLPAKPIKPPSKPKPKNVVIVRKDGDVWTSGPWTFVRQDGATYGTKRTPRDIGLYPSTSACGWVHDGRSMPRGIGERLVVMVCDWLRAKRAIETAEEMRKALEAAE